jgi:PAS domain-containing protein
VPPGSDKPSFEELHQTEERLQAVIESAPVGILEINLDSHLSVEEQQRAGSRAFMDDCSDSSNGAVSGESSSLPETPGFVGEQSSRLARPLVVQGERGRQRRARARFFTIPGVIRPGILASPGRRHAGDRHGRRHA